MRCTSVPVVGIIALLLAALLPGYPAAASYYPHVRPAPRSLPLRRSCTPPGRAEDDDLAGAGAVRNAKAAIDAMNQFYNKTDGRWSTAEAWWLSANALQVILDYQCRTGSGGYVSYAERTFELQHRPLPWWMEGGGYFRSDSTDDTAWWALAMLRFYDVTKNDTYLEVAMLDEAYIYRYWSDNCGGGVIWDIPTKSYKNAISNELYIALAAALHNRVPGGLDYLHKAKAAWNWFKASGMINQQHLVNDGLAEGADSTNGTSCTNNGGPVWTYNQGVVLGALVELFDATGNETYLAEAQNIADAVVASNVLSPRGILTESCEATGGCNGDQDMFKGIFCRNLDELSAVLPGDPYRVYLDRNARSMRENARNASRFYDVGWAEQFESSSLAKQASAASLLVALT